MYRIALRDAWCVFIFSLMNASACVLRSSWRGVENYSRQKLRYKFQHFCAYWIAQTLPTRIFEFDCEKPYLFFRHTGLRLAHLPLRHSIDTAIELLPLTLSRRYVA